MKEKDTGQLLFEWGVQGFITLFGLVFIAIRWNEKVPKNPDFADYLGSMLSYTVAAAYGFGLFAFGLAAKHSQQLPRRARVGIREVMVTVTLGLSGLFVISSYPEDKYRRIPSDHQLVGAESVVTFLNSISSGEWRMNSIRVMVSIDGRQLDLSRSANPKFVSKSQAKGVLEKFEEFHPSVEMTTPDHALPRKGRSFFCWAWGVSWAQFHSDLSLLPAKSLAAGETCPRRIEKPNAISTLNPELGARCRQAVTSR